MNLPQTNLLFVLNKNRKSSLSLKQCSFAKKTWRTEERDCGCSVNQAQNGGDQDYGKSIKDVPVLGCHVCIYTIIRFYTAMLRH